jgi:hypothetical protein
MSEQNLESAAAAAAVTLASAEHALELDRQEEEDLQALKLQLDIFDIRHQRELLELKATQKSERDPIEQQFQIGLNSKIRKVNYLFASLVPFSS